MAFELVSGVLVLQCIRDWPDDGRPYVALGTLLRKVGMVQEARKVFEDGCQAVRGENPYIWQVYLLFHLSLLLCILRASKKQVVDDFDEMIWVYSCST